MVRISVPNQNVLKIACQMFQDGLLFVLDFRKYGFLALPAFQVDGNGGNGS